jgi:ribosome-associated toxin RatA of RatAB toxin-antitoxin module
VPRKKDIKVTFEFKNKTKEQVSVILAQELAKMIIKYNITPAQLMAKRNEERPINHD